MMCQPKTLRRGFTLIELIVGMAILGILASLLLPAIQQAREAARCLSCRNNMRQLALALHNYESAHGVFPPSEMSAEGFGHTSPCDDAEDTSVEDNPTACTEYQSWTALTLPFLDQSTLSSRIDFEIPWSHLKNRPAVSTWLYLFLCPSTPSHKADDYHVLGAAPNDYGAINEVEKLVYTDTFGVPNPGHAARVGALAEHQPNHLRDIRDGLSQTALLGESAGRPFAYVHQTPMTASQFATYTGAEVLPEPEGYRVIDGIGWADPEANIEIKGVRDNGVTLFGPRFINALNVGELYSFHDGGVHLALADGSVRFVSESVDGWTLISVCTRAGGEVVSDF